MTVEDCRVILKVHILAADASGKKESAFSLLEVLDSIDRQIAAEIVNPHCRHSIHSDTAIPPVYGSRP